MSLTVSTAAQGWNPQPQAPQYWWSSWVFRDGQGTDTRVPSGVVPMQEMWRRACSSGDRVLVNLDLRALKKAAARLQRGAMARALAVRPASTRKVSRSRTWCFRVRATSTVREALATAAGSDILETACPKASRSCSRPSGEEAPPSDQHRSQFSMA